jgi:hypothetical protein
LLLSVLTQKQYYQPKGQSESRKTKIVIRFGQ